MSSYFEAVVLEADQPALIRWLGALSWRDAYFGPLTLTVSRVGAGRFVVFGWREGAGRPLCGQEMEDLADQLSLEFGKGVAVHYDDQVGLRAATLYIDGDRAAHFGQPDEVWVPYGEDGEPRMDGPRYPGNAVPDDVECDCIWNGIDAALEAAGFRTWLTENHHLVQVAYRAFREEPLWQRLGVPDNRRSGHDT
jgi:hypothetical protein